MQTVVAWFWCGLALALLAACGPVPGGSLGGQPAKVPSDWSTAFEGDHTWCEIEARPEDPHSIQLDCFVYERAPLRELASLGAGFLVAGQELGRRLAGAPERAGADRRVLVSAGRHARDRPGRSARRSCTTAATTRCRPESCCSGSIPARPDRAARSGYFEALGCRMRASPRRAVTCCSSKSSINGTAVRREVPISAL